MPITEYMPKRDFDKLRAEYLALTTEATMVIEERDQLRADLATKTAECERLRADAERYRLIQERFDTTKLSRSERFLEAIGLDPADAEKPLSDIVDAARAGKGE